MRFLTSCFAILITLRTFVDFMVILILIVVAFVAYAIFHDPDSEATKTVLKQKTRTEGQKKVIRYFLNGGGCLSDHRMKDEEYDMMVAGYLSQDHRSKALSRIGLDEDELKEIEPICFHGYDFSRAYARKGSDGLWRSSSYQISWLFFSANQLYLYQDTINFDCDEKRTSTEELFYKDVTSFSATTETEEVIDGYNADGTEKHANVESNKFKIVVPGDKFFAAMQLTPENERAIQGMKNKLREKKNA